MTDFSFQQRYTPDLMPLQGMLTRKEILDFSRALYPGDVGPEDVLEAACLIDAWQWGKVAFSIEKARDENVPEGEEAPGYCSLSDLRVLVSIKDDNQELSLEEQRHQEKTTLAVAQQALKKQTILAVCFAGVAAIEAASFFMWMGL